MSYFRQDKNQKKNYCKPNLNKSFNRQSSSQFAFQHNRSYANVTPYSSKKQCLPKQTEQPNSVYTSYVDNQIVCMNWSPSGSRLADVCRGQIKICQFSYSGGLKTNQKKQVDGQITSLRFLNQNVFGGFSSYGVKFWDIRQNIKQEVYCINFQLEQEWILFQINKSLEWITLGNDSYLKNYDFRRINNNIKLQQVNQLLTDFPFYDFKWYSCGNQYLVATGGTSNKGIVTMFDKHFHKSLQRQLDYSPIVSLSFANYQFKNEPNRVYPKICILLQSNSLQILEFPQFICQKVISIVQQQNIISCHLSYDQQYLTVIQQNQILIYEIGNRFKGKEQGRFINNKSQKLDFFDYDQPILAIESKFSPIAWHPHFNILAYVNNNDKNKVSLQKF